MKDYKNPPPKDLRNAIWGACFNYEDFDKVIDGITIRDRVYECWNRLHQIMKTCPDEIINHIKKEEPDL